MATNEERLQVLNMVAEGKVTAEEGVRLLAALEPSRTEGAQAYGMEPGTPRWFRVRVTDLETGKSKVNVNLPMSLVEVGTRMGARFAPDLEGVNFSQIVEQIKSGAQGKLIEVEDLESGERVEIFVE